MKKIEAKAMAPEKSQIVIGYITKILSGEECTDARITFGIAKIDNINTCVVRVYDPVSDLERNIDLEITSDHFMVLVAQLLNDLLDTFLGHESIKLTIPYFKKSMRTNFSGLDAISNNGSRIKINIGGSGTEYNELLDAFVKRYEEFEASLNNQGDIRSL